MENIDKSSHKPYISKTQLTINAGEKLEDRIAKTLFNSKEMKWIPESHEGLDILSTAWSMPDVTWTDFWNLLFNENTIRENIHSSFSSLIRQDVQPKVQSLKNEISNTVADALSPTSPLGTLTRDELSKLKEQSETMDDLSELTDLKKTIDDVIAKGKLNIVPTGDFRTKDASFRRLRRITSTITSDAKFQKRDLNSDEQKILDKIKNIENLYAQIYYHEDIVELHVYVNDIDQEFHKINSISRR